MKKLLNAMLYAFVAVSIIAGLSHVFERRLRRPLEFVVRPHLTVRELSFVTLRLSR